MTYILSNYPLSQSYRTQLEERIGHPPAYLVVSELRQAPISAVIRRFFATKGESLYIAFEDVSSRALLPILQMLGALTRVRNLYFVDEQLQIHRVRRAYVARAGLGLIRESARAAIALQRAKREMRSLLSAERIMARVNPGARAAYLNCNLWFGVKAGGSVGHISGVANALMDLGHPVDLYSAGGRLLVDDRANYIRLTPPAMLSIPIEATHYFFDRSCESQIKKHLESRPVGFLYQRMSLGNYTGVRLSRSLGIPLVLEYNGSEAWIAKHWGRPLRYHKTAVEAEDVCLRHAHVVVTVSQVLGDELEQRGVEKRSIVVYPNCIDPAVFDPDAYSAEELRGVRAAVGFAEEDTVATFIGTFGQWHGVDVLAQAIRYMIDNERDFLDRTRLRFLLVGDGLKMSAVKETLNGVRDRLYVRLTGLVPQREAPKYLAASDLLLSPHVKNTDGSAFFGSPTKLFEYLAMARGIVASNLDQLGEVLRPAIELPQDAMPDQGGEAVAVLVPPGDLMSLVNGIKLLVNRPELRMALGQNARKLALAKYTWRHHTQAILDKLFEVAG